MPEPCKFPSLDSCQERFLWTHKEIDLSLHPVVDLVLQVGDAEKFPQHLVSKALILFFSDSASRVHVSHSVMQEYYFTYIKCSETGNTNGPRVLTAEAEEKKKDVVSRFGPAVKTFE